MINAQDIKKGTCIRMDGKLYFCIDFLHVKPGKGNTFMRTKLKDVVNGYVLERRFNIGEALEDVRVERRPYQYLYQEGEDYIFMNQETFEQIPIAKELINGVDEGRRSRRCGFGCFYRDCALCRCADQGGAEGNLYRTGTERRYGHQHPEACHGGDRCDGACAFVRERG